MKTKNLCFIVAALSGLLATVMPASAQGTAFTYQGRLMDGANPATGSYDLRFALFDMPTNGTGTQQGNLLTNSATAVSNGVFTVTLDFGNQFPGAARWLEIAVRSNGVATFATLTPRQPLTPAPYAMFANTASNLSGTIANGALPASPNFSGTVAADSFSGNGSNLTSLNAGNITAGILSDARLSGNVALRGSANTFTTAQFFNGQIVLNSSDGFAQSSAGNFAIDAPFIGGGRFIVLANGNVGIGTNTPSQKLEVAGNATFAGSITGNGALPWQIVSGTTQQAQPNTGYLLSSNSLVTVTLPISPNIGDVVRVSGVGASGWKIVQNAGQLVSSANLVGNIGLAWTARDSSRQWGSVASSADGAKLVAVVLGGGQIYTSTDSGVTWTARDSSRTWVRVASSADGTKLVAGANGGQIYTSTDSGVTWTARDSSRVWASVASSADGTKLVAGANGSQIYTSVPSSVPSTTTGTAGYLMATPNSAIELQYFGNGQFLPISHEGIIQAF